MGCCSYMTLPSRSPLIAVPIPAMIMTIRPRRSELRITGTCFLRARWKADIPAMNAPPTRKAAVMVWKNWVSAVFWVSTSQKSVSSARPRSSLMRYPTGCCIHELAARMK